MVKQKCKDCGGDYTPKDLDVMDRCQPCLLKKIEEENKE